MVARRRVHRRRPGHRRGRRAHHARSARCCAATRSTSCPTCGTSCAARCRSWGRGRRSRARSTSTPSASAAAWPSSPGSPAGPRSTAAPRCPGPSGSSWTSGTSSTARWRWTCASCRARSARWCAATASTREPPADGSPPADVAVLLTGVGKRYTLVSVFAQHALTIAADPNPLAPAQYAAHHRRSVPRFDDPAYVPALQELCAEFGVGAVVPLTDLDLEILGHAREDGPAARVRSRRRGCACNVRQVRDPPAAAAPGAPLAARRCSRASPSTATR